MQKYIFRAADFFKRTDLTRICVPFLGNDATITNSSSSTLHAEFTLGNEIDWKPNGKAALVLTQNNFNKHGKMIVMPATIGGETKYGHEKPLLTKRPVLWSDGADRRVQFGYLGTFSTANPPVLDFWRESPSPNSPRVYLGDHSSEESASEQMQIILDDCISQLFIERRRFTSNRIGFAKGTFPQGTLVDVCFGGGRPTPCIVLSSSNSQHEVSGRPAITVIRTDKYIDGYDENVLVEILPKWNTEKKTGYMGLTEDRALLLFSLHTVDPGARNVKLTALSDLPDYQYRFRAKSWLSSRKMASRIRLPSDQMQHIIRVIVALLFGNLSK